MLVPKRISLTLAAIIFISVVVVVFATTYGAGKNDPAKTDNPSNGEKIKVFRRKDQRAQPPNAGEITYLRRQRAKEEREVEDKIPKHVPIKIKLKADKEKAFKDMGNENWQRDFELEVTNASNKPIYFLELLISYPEVISELGHRVGVPLRYGRTDFMNTGTLAVPADVPIPPGGSYLFTIPESDQRGWLAHKTKEHRRDPKKIEIRFAQLDFGDGTGFEGLSAEPYPHKKDTWSTAPCREGLMLVAGKGGTSETQTPLYSNLRDSLFGATTGRFSAGFLFLGAPFDPGDLCCPGTPNGCEHVKRSTSGCVCGVAATTVSVACSDPAGACSMDFEQDRYCEFDTACPEWYMDKGACATGTPTPEPSPAPSPSPSPSPTCDPATKPNNSNCQCADAGGGTVDWACGCADGSQPADHYRIPDNYGCPGNKYNDRECCVCIELDHTCANSDCHWDTYFCECVDFVGTPCAAATPTPFTDIQPGGDGNGDKGCVDYYW